MSPTTTTRREQAFEALGLANQTKLARATVKRRVRSARSRSEAWAIAAEVVEDTPERLQSMMVIQLLSSCRQTGSHVAHRLLAKAGIYELRTLGGLTDRQRRALTSRLRQLELEL